MSPRIGTQPGTLRRATITKYNGDGSVSIALDEAGLTQRLEINVPISLAWTGQSGEFLGGYPRVGSSVVVSQGQGGQWFILAFLPSNQVFNDRTSYTRASLDDDKMSAFKPGRILAQVKDGTRIFLDPELGVQVGNYNNYQHIDPNLKIISHNFSSQFDFTEASRSIQGVIKRDLVENANRNLLGSTLDSHIYDKSLFTIGLDPSSRSAPSSTGNSIRNPPLVENHEIIYEFAQSSSFTTDQDEATRYVDPKNTQARVRNSRREMRVDALSLSLEYPNHLLETIKGTAVDLFGNIVDINRNPLPLGKIDLLSFRKNPDKSKAFQQMRAQLRKSIAYHFEINARKGNNTGDTLPPPDTSKSSDYARDRSRFSLDIDKEGQIKLNIPASSEIGNLPLLTRAENYSVLKAKEDSSILPNAFVRPSNNQDIYLENFAGKASINISGGSDDLDGYEAPTDRITDNPIKYGTAFHDITKTCSEFQESAGYLQVGQKIINYDLNNRLNTNFVPLPKIVSDTVIVSGDEANAGGRSGLINLDGMMILNIGANTIDRQSLWVDCAGGVVSNIGRDRQGISYAANFDGDCFIQIGGGGIGNSFDSRFSDLNDAYRNGNFEIRVLQNGQMMVLRLGSEGITIASPGTITFSSQQDMIFRSNSNILMEAENIMLYAETTKRIVNRFPNNTTIG